MSDPAAPRTNPILPAISAKEEEFRKRIEHDPQLKRDFDLLIAKTGLPPIQVLRGLLSNCNLMKADRQTLLRKENEELWPISEDTLRRTIKNIRRAAGQIETTNETELFSPARTGNATNNFPGLPEALRSYAAELERTVNIWAHYSKQTKSSIPTLVALLRQISIYERIRSSTGKYHQTRLLRLVNAARAVKGLPKIELRAFTVWLNRFEKRRKEYDESWLSDASSDESWLS